MKWKLGGISLTVVSLAALLGACSGNTDSAGDASKASEPAKKEAAPQPVTIKYATSMTVEEFNQYVAEPVRKRYPHITVERIDYLYNTPGKSIQDLVTTKNIPDIFVAYPTHLLPYVDLGLAYDMTELIKQNQFDLNRIPSEFYETIKLGVLKDYLIGLPINNNAFGLFYNKSLFDQFGVPYPKDGMTWQDVRNTAVKLTRNVNGVQYIGIHPDSISRGARQLSLPYIDLKSDKAAFQTQSWKDLFELWQSLFQVPGGAVIPKGTNMAKSFTEGTTAMIGGYALLMNDMNNAKSLQWDVVTYPTNPQNPGVGSVVDSLVACITSPSKYKTEAFQVLSVILSNDVQNDMSRNAMMSVLSDRAVQDQFGKNNA
ncbi:MAG: transporter substrate-binding protein, partial [Paenibacillus sp.]|nr:transporter substrate-binding protein [Paenibacillus sp.]